MFSFETDQQYKFTTSYKGQRNWEYVPSSAFKSIRTEKERSYRFAPTRIKLVTPTLFIRVRDYFRKLLKRLISVLRL